MRLKSGVLLAGLFSFVALASAKLRWKCELFDTSQETSTRTTFVDFVKSRPPQPNPRPVRSTSSLKCRPRPKNGTVGPSTDVEKMKIETKKALVQEDVPRSAGPEETDAPIVKYRRKESHQSTDLNIGPGFEDSDDPYGRSKQPVPRLFRPAELKGADELEKPLTEHLEQNVMPDFEFDDDDGPPVQEDLPWCPEEPEECETADLKTMSTSELVEWKQKCESTTTPERLELVDKLIATDDRNPMNPRVEPTTDRTAALPPTGSTNCSESPSKVSKSKLEQYRKECPCEDETDGMDVQEFEQFKRDCLEPIEIPGDAKKLIRKNGRCGASQKAIDKMGEDEYRQFVKECLVGPKNITLQDILVVEKSPECVAKKLKSVGRKEFSDFQKKCLKRKKCDEDVDEKLLSSRELSLFKKACSSAVRKTSDLCETENPDELDDEQFVEYKRKCIFDRTTNCDSVDVDSLSEKEYGEFEKECSDVPMDCEDVKDPETLSRKQKKRYQRDCLPGTPDSPPPMNAPWNCERADVKGMSRKQYSAYKRKCHVTVPNCKKAAMDLEKMSEEDFQIFLFECSDQKNCKRLKWGSKATEREMDFSKRCAERKKYCSETKAEDLEGSELTRYQEECEPIDCDNVNPDDLDEKKKLRYRKECEKEEDTFDCDNVNPEDLGVQERKKYEKECLGSPIDCSSVDPKSLSRKEFRRFEKRCVKKTSQCRDVKVDELSDDEYQKYTRDCLNEKEADLDCESTNPEELEGKDLESYQERCGEKTGVDCTADPRKLSKKQYRKFEKKCLKEKKQCEDVDVNDLNEEEYETFQRLCLKEPETPAEEEPGTKNPDELGDCKDVDVEKLSKEEYETFKKGCRTDSSPDCEDVDVQKMSDEEFREYKKKCAKPKDSGRSGCSDVNVDDLTDEEYKTFQRRCGKTGKPKKPRGSPDEESPDSEDRTDCRSVDAKKLSRKQFQRYEKKCFERKSSIDCDDVNPESLNDEEYEKYRKECLRKKNAFNCTNVKPEEMSEEELEVYERECLDEEGPDCDDVEPSELSRKQLKRYERRCLEKKSSEECDRNLDEMSDEEYEKYKRECRKRKKTFDCDTVDPKKLSAKERRRYERQCTEKIGRSDCKGVRPEELNEEEYAKYKRDCLDTSSDCKDLVPEEMSRKEFRKYERDCLSGRKRSPECERVELEELNDEEFARHKKTCSVSPGDNVEIRKSVVVRKSPEDGVSSDCDGDDCNDGKKVTLVKKIVVVNGTPETPERLDGCEDVDVEKMAEHEYNAYKKKCKVTFEGEDCDDVSVKELNGHKLQEYIEKCGVFCGLEMDESVGEKEKKTFEERCEKGAEELEKDCKDVVLENIGERLLGDFADKCVEHIDACSMLKSRRLVRKVYNDYRLKCNSRLRPSHEIDCNQTATETLTPEQFREFEKKCGGKRRDTCDDVDVDGLDEQEFERYKRRCGIDRSDENCKHVDVETLSRSEYRRYLKKCGRTPSEVTDDDCDDVRIEEISQKKFLAFVRKCGNPADTSIPNCSHVDLESLSTVEFEQYKRRCLESTKPSKERSGPPGGENPHGSGPFEICSDDVDVENLSVDDYKEYSRKCLKRKTARPECDDVDVDSLDAKAFRQHKKRCGRPVRRPDHPDREDCHLVKIEELSADEYVEYKRRCLGKPKDRQESDECSKVEVENLTEDEYREHKRKCSTRKTSKPGCEDVDWKNLSAEERRRLQKTCGSPESPDFLEETSEDCSSVDVSRLTRKEYRKYQRRCGKKVDKPECDDVDVENMSDEEFRIFKKKCSVRAPPDSVSIQKTVVVKKNPDDGSLPDDCSDAKNLSEEEYKRRCLTRKTSRPGCDDVDVKNLSHLEYLEYQKRCGEPRVPVSVEKTVVVKKNPREPGRPYGDCSNVNVAKLSDEEFVEYKKECRKTRKTSSADCEDVDVSSLSEEEYLRFKKKCPVASHSGKCSDVRIEELSADEYAAYKRRCLKRRTTPEEDDEELGDCKDVDVKKLSKEEYETFRKGCRTDSSPDCEDVDVQKMSDEEFQEYKKKCAKSKDSGRSACSDVNVDDLTDEEYEAFQRRCGKTGKPNKTRGSPDEESPDSEDCSDVNVEELSAKEYAVYKRRCLKDRKEDENCSKIDVNDLTEKEYRAFRRRCPESVTVRKKIVISAECQNKDTESMTKQEYQKYLSDCSSESQKPHIELTKIVKIVEGPSRPGSENPETEEVDECLNRDVNTMDDGEYREFRSKCGVFRKTFQFNCSSDVSKMSDGEFRRFRKVCGKKAPFDCETADVDVLSDDEYERFLKECGRKQRKTFANCGSVKVERMTAQEFEAYREKCLKPKTSRKSHDECEDVKVEELSKKEYAVYKEKCLKKPETLVEEPVKERKKIDCSIMDTSQMSREEYADFKKHCNVRVQTDRFRPGENIILTKKVEIHTGKEPFSCYDRDVDAMSDEEYAEFERRCLQNPHFRYDCSNVDTTHLEKDEYVEYQRQCQQPKTVVLTKKLVVNKTNGAVKGGCYDRNVDGMSEEEYEEYERDCLGITRKPHRKAAIDCHNVDLSKLSYAEIEEHLKMCRSRETASTPAPRRRQSLRCSDVNVDNLDEEAYAKWVRECLETRPKTIELEKKLIINTTSPLMSGGETVTVEKVEIRRHTRPDDDEGYIEGKEDFGVRLRSGTRKTIRQGVDDDDQESETGVILVKKVIHKVPRRRRPMDADDEDDEGGVIKVKKLIMKTSRPEPEGDDSEDVEEIVRRPRKKVGPKEEVVLLSVTKRHGHPYRTKSAPEEEEPVEIVKLKRNTMHPGKVLREVRIRKHFGQGLPDQEEAVVQEIGGPDFRIIRKTVMVPRRVRKMKSTTTTTTTPAEPEYYYDEEEVPEIVTLVKVDQSRRPLRKHARPVDEDDEYVDVKEDEPKTFIEFEGFVKVHGAPRKIRRRPKYTDSGEEPEIREVTRKVVMQPGGEDDDLEGVRLKSHRKMLRRKTTRPEDVPEDAEHEVTVVKKLKVLKFGDDEKETFEEEENPDEDGQVIVRNRKRKYSPNEKTRPEEEEEDEEVVEGRVAVKGRAPKRFRLEERPGRKNAVVKETNSQYFRIGGSEEDDVEKRKRRRKEEEFPKALEESEEGERRRRRRPGYEEESEEIGKKRGRAEEEEELRKKPSRSPSGHDEDYLTEKIKKFYRIGPNGERELIPNRDKGQGEAVTLMRKKTLRLPERKTIPEADEDENEEIKLLKRKKFYRIGSDGKRELIRTEGEPAEEGDVVGKKTLRAGASGPMSHDRPGVDQSEEVVMKKRKKKIYRIGPDGKRELVREEEVPEEEEEDVSLKKNKKQTSGPDGKRGLMEEMDGEKRLLGENENTHSPTPLEDDDQDGEEVHLKKKKRFYRIGPDGKRELIRTEGEGEDQDGKLVKKVLLGRKSSSYSPIPLAQDETEDVGSEGEEILMKKRKKKTYRVGPDGKRELVREEEVPEGEDQDGEEVHLRKKKRFYRIGPDGKRELIRTEDDGDGKDDGQDGEEVHLKKKKRFYRVGPDGKRQLIREEGGEEEPEGSDGGEEVLMHKKKKKSFYRIGPDGKRELIRTEHGNGKQMLGEKENTQMPSEGEETHLKRKKRFYQIGPDGKRELIRTEGDDGNDEDVNSGSSPSEDLSGLRKYGEPNPIRKSTKEDVQMWQKAFEKRRNEEQDQEKEGVNLKLSRKTHVKANGEKKVEKVAEAEEGEDVKARAKGDDAGEFKSLMADGEIKPPPGKKMKKEISQRGFIEGGPQEPSDFHGDDSMVSETEEEDGGKMGKGSKRGLMDEEEVVRPRKKRTYVVDKDGNRQLVAEQTGDEEVNLDLGKLLRPKKKVTETETIKRKHKESRFEERGSKRVTSRSSRKKRKMQKYRKDDHVRSSGKSEEEVPKEKIGD